MIDSEIACLIARKLGMTVEQLHDLTCSIKSFHTHSGITGDDYVTEKVLQLKVKIVIEECRLIDDVEVKKGR